MSCSGGSLLAGVGSQGTPERGTRGGKGGEENTKVKEATATDIGKRTQNNSDVTKQQRRTAEGTGLRIGRTELEHSVGIPECARFTKAPRPVRLVARLDTVQAACDNLESGGRFAKAKVHRDSVQNQIIWYSTPPNPSRAVGRALEEIVTWIGARRVGQQNHSLGHVQRAGEGISAEKPPPWDDLTDTRGSFRIVGGEGAERERR
jgi:hypothetical protein